MLTVKQIKKCKSTKVLSKLIHKLSHKDFFDDNIVVMLKQCIKTGRNEYSMLYIPEPVSGLGTEVCITIQPDIRDGLIHKYDFHMSIGIEDIHTMINPNVVIFSCALIKLKELLIKQERIRVKSKKVKLKIVKE
jgi:hypothetical protein